MSAILGAILSAIGLRSLFAALAVVCVFTLTACGGGGGGTPPTADAGPAKTVLAGDTVLLDGSASSEAEGSALSYSWSIASAPLGSALASAFLPNSARAQLNFVPDLPGVYTVNLMVSNGTLSGAAASTTVTALGAGDFSIVMNKAEPLEGFARLSLSSSFEGMRATWYRDLAPFATGPEVTWDTNTAANGSHQLMVRIEGAGSRSLEVRRAVVVENASSSPLSLGANVMGTTGSIRVDVGTSSPFGIASVTAVFNSMPLGSLSAPNTCSRRCGLNGGGNDAYQFNIDATQLASGVYTLLLIATDSNGNSRQLSVPVPVTNAPVVSLTSPVDGSFVRGALAINGGVSPDGAGPVTVVLSLRGMEFLTTTAASFNSSYDLSGLAAGAYTLKVQATSSMGAVTTIERKLTVASSPALTYEPILSLGATGQLLAAEGHAILYAAEDLSLRLRDTVTASEVRLQDAAVAWANNWSISDGRVYARGQGSDCTANAACVYQWDASGARSNLTAATPWAASTDQVAVLAKAGYVLWCNKASTSGGTSYTLFDVAAGTYSQILPAGGITALWCGDYDFAVVGGVVNLVHWVPIGTAPVYQMAELYRWTSDARAFVRLSTAVPNRLGVVTDGARVAWAVAPGDPGTNRSALTSAPLSGNPTTTLSPAVRSFALRDGVLVWAESSADSSLVSAATTSATTMLALGPNSSFYGTRNGTVVYASAGRLYSWNSTLATSRLRAEAEPTQVLVTATSIYFVTGSAKNLYKLALE